MVYRIDQISLGLSNHHRLGNGWQLGDIHVRVESAGRYAPATDW